MIAVVLVLLLCACGDSGGGGVTDNGGKDVILAVPDLPAFTPPEKNALVGRVLSSTGQGLEGVAVSADSGGSAVTNYDGYYFIADVPPRDRIVVSFREEGFIPATRSGAMVLDGRTVVNAVLLPRVASKPLGDGAAVFSQGTVTLDKSAVVDLNGVPVTGDVQVRATPIPTRGAGVIAAPGDFSATTQAGATAQLETYAMSDYQVVGEDGAELKIGAGKTADIEMLLPADTTLEEGDVLPAWHFDDVTGRWIEEGTGTVVKYSADPTRLAFKATVSHFSTWNCDKTMETTCISGTVKLCDGTPAPSADLSAQGVSYDGTSGGFAGLDGTFCVAAKTGATVTLAAASGYGAARLVAVTTVQTGTAASSCPGPCTQADIVLPCSPKDSTVDCDDTWFAGCTSCVQGRVVDKDGNPRPAVLKAAAGNSTFTVVTDQAGHYCAPAAKGALVTITASGPSGETGAITTVPQNAGQCPDCETAPDLTLNDAVQTGTEGLDFATCPTDLGGLALTGLVANGSDPRLAKIDGGWVTLIDRGATMETGRWQLAISLVSSKSVGIAGAPIATVDLYLDAAPTAAATFDVADGEGYVVQGSAWSAAGSLTGLGGETYQLQGGTSSPIGSGQIRFDGGFANVGDPVKGSFVLSLVPGCAPKGASLNLKGTFDTTVHASPSTVPDFSGGVDSPAFKYWKCSMFDLFVTVTTMQYFEGAIQMTVDGVMAATEANPLDTAKYEWEQDSLTLAFYGKDTTLSLSVEHPVAGENLVTYGTLFFADSECYYQPAGGKVVLVAFNGAETDRWLTGTFDIQFTAAAGSVGNCPDRLVEGQFGAPVCR